jgi:hypothetical protein
MPLAAGECCDQLPKGGLTPKNFPVSMPLAAGECCDATSGTYVQVDTGVFLCP